MVLAAVGVILVLVAAALFFAWLYRQKRHSDALRERFGPEYERTVQATGDARAAEAELEARQKRVAALDIRPLPAAERERYLTRWRAQQAAFVDEPAQAIAEANQLVSEVMQARGYVVGDFETRVADLSVNHANFVGDYRAARRIAQNSQVGQASTEDLRQAMVHYRALFEALLDTRPEESEKDAVR
jgi:hypothetical protein